MVGAVSFLHRGSSLNPHFHFHLVVLDGVLTEADDEVRFDEATHFSADDACERHTAHSRPTCVGFVSRPGLPSRSIVLVVVFDAPLIRPAAPTPRALVCVVPRGADVPLPPPRHWAVARSSRRLHDWLHHPPRFRPDLLR